MGPYIYIEFSKNILSYYFIDFVSNFEPVQVGTDEIY